MAALSRADRRGLRLCTSSAVSCSPRKQAGSGQTGTHVLWPVGDLDSGRRRCSRKTPEEESSAGAARDSSSGISM